VWLRRLEFALIVLCLFAWSVPVTAGTVALEERLEAQRALDEVRWSHRLWPASNPGPKPALSELITDSDVRDMVVTSLTQSAALERIWGHPITAELLQAEVARMARDTRDPKRLRELFAVLNDDPLLIAECLARPTLVERTIRQLYAYDPDIHGALKTTVQNRLVSEPDVRMWKNLGGEYVEVVLLPDFVEASSVADVDIDPHRSSVGAEEWVRLNHLPSAAGAELIERASYFEVEAVIEKTAQSVRLARVRWHKPSFESWWRAHSPEQNLDELAVQTPGAFSYSVPATREDTCTDDTWLPTSTGTDVPDPREDHTAIWTGSEMIVWGGRDPSPLGTGGMYDPATDSWTPTTGVSAPSPRFDHTAVWTGTEMIVWGGFGTLFENSGGRFNPTSNSWTPTLTGTDVPDGRYRHTAVWTDSEMIVWGGYDGDYLNTGGRYTLTPESWKPTSTTGDVPDVRYDHTAVWSRTEMIVWGGYDGFSDVNTGGLYDPSSDSWATTSVGANVPAAREDHTVVWTGSEMVVWGGAGTMVYDSGGRYAPSSDSWEATSTTGDVPSARRWHTAVWADGEMIVWGGIGGENTGGRYLPATDEWTATSTGTDVPDARRHHSAVWIAPANSQMIVWGGFTTAMTNTGGLYCAVCAGVTWYRDSDEDAFGDPNTSQSSCNPVPGYILDGSDCDDSNATVYPGADQVCDGVNNDCDHPSWPGLAGTNEFDNDGDTFSTCGGDCDDGDGTIWMIPGEVRQLTIDPDRQFLSWLPPALPGGTTPLYDTIRAGTPTTFESAGFCVASDEPATSSSDVTDPGAGTAFFYLIRAENGCGVGSVGSWSDGTARSARVCP